MGNARFLLLAEMSNDAYVEDLSFGESRFPGYQMKPIVAPLTQSFARIYWNSSEVILAFRGTDNLMNVISYIKFWKKDDLRAGVHTHDGFYDSMLELDEYISVVIPILTSRRVTLTGHSLGGALATIYAMWLIRRGIQVGEVTTFGQPKVTDWKGCKTYWFMQPYYTRFVNEDDPIPMLPPWTFSTMFAPYRHFGREFLMKKDGSTVITVGKDASTFGADSVAKLLFKGKLEFKDFEQHHMAVYLENIHER